MYLPSTVAISANVRALMDILMMLRIDRYRFGILALMKACILKTSPLRRLSILVKSLIISILLTELTKFCCELLGVLLQSCTNSIMFLYQHLVTYSFALSQEMRSMVILNPSSRRSASPVALIKFPA